MVSFEIRAAVTGDEDQLLYVARHLNSVNLPNNRDAIHEIVAREPQELQRGDPGSRASASTSSCSSI